ncbi:hypothetical protein [Chondrinema litorale]|uniref:hypothetical protein n=1 Tax=Chondrinema litorale TaxID=2994555 RepID=UPI00254271F3|nr:hypothetical protein [Chondrinema litorale]UZR94749.1 hypothetical protein OQ292_02825 [Chondrinema litorale]
MNFKVLISYLSISSLLLTDIILYINWEISYRGYWTDRILFWIWFSLTTYIIYYYWNKKIIKIYVGALISFIILSMLPMMIPFIIIITTITGTDRSCNQEISENIRIQEIAKSPIAMPQIQVIEKTWLIDKVIGERDFSISLGENSHRICNAESITLEENLKGERMIIFSFEDGEVEWKLD